MANNKKSKQVDAQNPTFATEHSPCGYSIYEINKADSKWKCIYCFLIMKEPTQLTECGHRCCKGCFQSRAASTPDDTMTCPVEDCHAEFRKNQVKIYFCLQNLVKMSYIFLF